MEYKCSVCLDKLFSENTDVCVTPCRHLFHKVCIDGCMQNKLECPNCKTGITPDVVNKLHLDVFDELAYSDCTIETKKFLEQMYDNERQKRETLLKILKKLDKENASLKETNKTNQEVYKKRKTFLIFFQRDNKNWLEKKLKLKNKKLRAEIGKLNNGVVNNESEVSNVEFGKQIEKNDCGDTDIECCTNIETYDGKGILIFNIILFCHNFAF